MLGRYQLAWLCSCMLLLGGCTVTHEERWRLYNEDGVLLFAKGNYRDALDSFNAALTQRPHDPILLYNSAQCYDRLGDTKKAEQFYASCLQIDSKHADAHLALLTLIHTNGRQTEANEKIREWLAQDPKSADPYVADAWRLRSEKDYPAAQGRLQQALSIEPQNRRALTELAVLYEIMGANERSLVLYQRILDRDPQQSEIAAKVQMLKAKGVKPPLPD